MDKHDELYARYTKIMYIREQVQALYEGEEDWVVDILLKVSDRLGRISGRLLMEDARVLRIGN